jgi:hypothetical protein
MTSDTAAPLPLPASALTSRTYCNRVPDREADGEFWSFQTWVNKACSWIGGTNPLCVDAFGRRCSCGADFMLADSQGAFPVRFWYGEGGQSPAEQRRSKAAHKRAMKLHYPWRFQ